MIMRSTNCRLVLCSVVGAMMLVGFLVSWVGADPRGSQMKVHAPVIPPKLIALRFHHDMCPYCREFAPKFARTTERASQDAVLYVTLDMSTEASQIQAALLVGALGLDDLWPGDLSKIATVTFVNGRTKREMSTFRADGNGRFDHAVRDALATLGDNR